MKYLTDISIVLNTSPQPKLQILYGGVIMKDYRILHYKTAKALHKKGVKIIVAPRNARLETPWHIEMEVTGDFNEFVNAYKYYNCNNELGKTLKYYMEV